MKDIAKQFKDFINRGNLVELAVAFVLGITFAALIKAFIDNIVMPIIAIPFGKPNFDQALVLTINDAEIRIGAFITALVTFIAVAIVLFLIVMTYNTVTRRDTTPATTEVDLLTEIRDELRQRPR
jgi:large conductance mechanosensitive channel